MKKLLIYSLLLVVNLAMGQTNFQSQFKSGKEFFRDGRYNLAMESFKPLIAYDKNNPFNEYASFYYALSAFLQGYDAVAKDMLMQIKKLYPAWDRTAEVDYWLGRIYFKNGDYFQGLRMLNSIKDKNLQNDIRDVKVVYLRKVSDLETLRMMYEDYPKDGIVARYLALALSNNLEQEEDLKSLEEIVKKFSLDRKEFIPEVPETVFKDRYSVALMLPFGVSYLEPTAGRKRNQVILDFYEGMELAQDSLAATGVNISLRAYDTERSTDKLKRLLSTEELKSIDVIIGPLFPEENELVQQFSEENQINVVHPFSNLSETTKGNPYGFLFQPSAEVMGRKAADFIAEHAQGKKSIVFFGTGKKDSVLATSFMQTALERGIDVVVAERIAKEESRVISDILATPTEFDEFKYPTQFTLAKDSIESIFVASDDPLIYTKVVGAVEMRGDSIMVVGSENWLDDNTIEYDKIESLQIVLQSPNFTERSTAQFKKFHTNFVRTHGRVPSDIARLGYELMMFVGTQLKQNGVYFQEALAKKESIPGFLGEGFDYRFSRSNQVVPFTTIKSHRHVLIEKR